LIVYLKVLVAAIRLLKMTGSFGGEYEILSLYESAGETILELPLNTATRSPGQSSLFWDSRKGHALVERIDSSEDQSISRFKVLKLYTSKLPAVGNKVWLSGWLGNHPNHFGLGSKASEVQMPNGTLAWLFDQSSDKWVIHIHGRRAERGETLRNIEQFAQLGFSQLTISMSTDPTPSGLGVRKSNLGHSEWREIEQATAYAQSLGAKEIILFGWSQGALITGAFLNRAEDISSISGVIFDSPLLDYSSTMRLHAKKEGFNEEAGDSVMAAIRDSRVLKLLGYSNIAVDELSLVTSGLPKHLPALILYSSSDGYVAMDEVHKLTTSNTNVRLVEIAGAVHCRLFNHDQRTYQNAIANWLKDFQI